MASPTSTDTFSYGSITLGYAHTIGLEEDPVFDPSGTDYVCTKIRLTVAGVLAHNVVPGGPGLQASDVAKSLEHYLMTPRERLRYRVGGRTVFAVDPPDAAGAFTPTDGQIGAAICKDANNGPKPAGLSFPLVTAGSIVVEFTVEFWIVTCKSGAAERRGYASNRYEQHEDFDEIGYRTLRTSGLMIGRSDLKGDLDQYRAKVVPPVPRGYQRLSSKWTLAPDGLRLRYEFVDKEYYLGPPDPAKKAGGKLLVASSNAGATFSGQANLWLEAGKTTAKRDLMGQAIKIIFALLDRFAVKSENKRSPMAQASFGTDLYANRVEVSCRLILDAKKIQIGPNLDNISLDIFTQDIPFSPKTDQPGIAPPIRGLFPLMELIAAEYQDPCVLQTMLVSNVTPPTGLSLPSQGTNPAAIAQSPVSLTPPGETVEVPYDQYLVSMKYRTVTGDVTERATRKGDLHPRVKLHQATLQLTVSWTAERVGQTPDIPDPCPPDATKVPDPLLNGTLVPNYVLTEQVIQTEQLTRMAGGAYKHVITGVYYYDVRDPCKVPLVEAIPPFLVKEIKSPPPNTPQAILQFNGVQNQIFAAPSAPRTPPLPAPPWLPPISQAITGGDIATMLGLPPSPAIPPAVPPANQPAFKTNGDVFWWRLATVKPVNELMCGGCPTVIIGELVGNPGQPFPGGPVP